MPYAKGMMGVEGMWRHEGHVYFLVCALVLVRLR